MTEPAVPRPVPVPWLTVAGQAVSTSVAGSPLVAVDELAVTWGRSSVLAQPAPATAQVSLFDRTRTWAMGRDLIGAALTSGYQVPGSPAVVTFRGRVQDVEVRPHTIVTTDGPVRGSVIDLKASSVLVDLANRRPTAAWPQETVQARANRIAGLAPVVLAGGVYFRSGPGGRVVKAIEAKDQRTLLEHLDRLADAAGGDRLIYDANASQLHYIGRRRYPGTRGMARVQWEYGGPPPAGRGAQLVAMTNAMPDPYFPVIGEYRIPWRYCTPRDDALSMDASARLSTIQVEYWDSTANQSARVEVAVPGTDEATEGVRSLSVSTDLVGSTTATTCASELATLAAQEGHRWAPPAFTYRPRFGGWRDEVHADALLTPWESEATFAIGGTWLPSFGQRPVFGVMGGTIRYAGGEWHITCTPAPVAPPDTAQHAITWEELGPDDSGNHVLLYDAPHPRGFHPSLALDDLRYAAMGVGDAFNDTPGPDQGWDSL